MKFKIEITETLQRIIEIEANSAEEAITSVRRDYRSEDVVLMPEEIVSTAFAVVD